MRKIFLFLTLLISVSGFSLSLSLTHVNPLCHNDCNGSITATASGGTLPYQYSIDGGATWQSSNIFTSRCSGNYSVIVKDAVNATATASTTLANPTAITFTATPVNCTAVNYCDGQIIVNITGGTPPYTITTVGPNGTQNYSSSPIINQCAGTYTVTVNDANACHGNGNTGVIVVIGSPSSTSGSNPPSFNLSQSPHCNCSITLTINAFGGVPPYQYSFDGGFSYSTQNTINLFQCGAIHENCCVKGADGSISCATEYAYENFPIGVTITQTNAGCSCTGSINMVASNGFGSPAYTITYPGGFQGSGSFTNLCPGTYSCVAMDIQGCVTIPQTITITQPAPPFTVATTTTNTSCYGTCDGKIVVVPSPGPVSNYQFSKDNGVTWQSSDTISGLCAGTYHVAVSNGTCNGYYSYTVTQPGAVPLTISSLPPNCTNGCHGMITCTPTTGSTSPYQWSDDNGATWQSTNVFSSLCAGTYPVKVKDVNGCSSSSNVTLSGNQLNAFVLHWGNPSCYGSCNGQLTLSGSPGGAGFEMSADSGNTWLNWPSSLVFNQCAGTKYIMAQNTISGCVSLTSTFVLTQPPQLAFSTSQTNPTCSSNCNGSITSTIVTGVSPPYSWSINGGVTWQSSPTFSGLCQGTYTVTMKNSVNCTVTQPVTLTAPPPITFTSQSIAASCSNSCNGSIHTSGFNSPTSPYTWSIDNGSTWQTDSAFTNLCTSTYTVIMRDANNCTSTQTVTVASPPALTLTASTANVNCNGNNNGAIDLSVTGGTAGYSYSWSNTANTQDISGLIPGAYSVSVTDANNCVSNSSFTITEPAALGAAGTITNVNCNGANDGSINLIVSGGTPAYSYLWSNGAATEDISGLDTGSYAVSITDLNGCTASFSTAINEPSPIIISSSVTNTSCSGSTGAIDLSVSGGMPGYIYLWSNGATTQDLNSIPAGNYNVTVTDNNNCSSTASITITSPAGISLSSSVNDVDCNGGNNGSINISASGGSPGYSYLWSNSQITQNISSLTAGPYSVTVTDNNGCIYTSSYTVTEPSPLTIASVLTNVNCAGSNNGMIDIIVSGGISSYVYSWSNSATTEDISGLSPGVYTITATDSHNCSTTSSYVITQPLPLSLSSMITDVDCHGASTGIIDLSVNGGTGAYSYSWSNSSVSQDLSMITAGTYSVSVTDANGCSTTGSFTLTEPSAITSSGIVTNVTCNGGTDGMIDLSVNGGSPGYLYFWSNSALTEDISGLSSGMYSLTVTDSKGCTETASFNVTEPSPILLSIVTTDPYCSGGIGLIDLSVSGGNPAYTYSWSNGSTTEDINAMAGTYSVTVTDAGGCTAATSTALTAPNAITLSQTHINASVLNNDGSIDVSVNGGTPPYLYSWSNGATTEDLSGLSSNTYTLTVTDASGCTDTISVFIDISIGIINPNASAETITVYPNPSDGTIFIRHSANDQLTLVIYDMSGRILSQEKLKEESTSEVQLDLSSGAYLLRVMDGDVMRVSEKLMIVR